jgi:tripartite-type tricarboxylate transporter receptor subunit TctC
MMAAPRSLLGKAILAAILASAILTAAKAQEYPAGQLRIIAPGPPGSPRDLRARWVAERLGPALDRTVIVDNRAGAGGNIGMEAAARSAPDGRTLVLVDIGTMAQNPHVYERPGYDALTDFTPVIALMEASLLLVVPSGATASTVEDLVREARAKPGKLSYGSSGIGTPPHLAAELFTRTAGIEVLHVPYKGAPPAIQDLVSGRLDFVIDSAAVLRPLVAAGKLRALAVSGDKRFEGLPNVPTMAESGLAGATYGVWMGVAVPARTSPALVDRLNREIAHVLGTETAREWFRNQGATVTGGSSAEFERRIVADYEKWRDVIRAAGIKAQ